MKPSIPIYSAFVCIISSLLAMGSPDHEVRIEERLLGSNADGYITLRSEVDNLGSYFGYRTRRFLVEYSKLQADPKSEIDLGAEVRSQLLLDVSTSIDPDQPAKESERLETKDDDVKLAELVARFPDQPKRWDDGKSRMIECDVTNGPRVDGISIAWGGWIKERFGADRNGDLEWTLGEVFEDANCLYLSVSSGMHGQRLVSVPPRKTRQIRDYLSKQAVYLVAGKFKSEEEATAKARELMDNAKGKFLPEVWSVGRWSEEMIYVVVDSQSADHISGGAFETLEATTGLDFSVMNSQLFSERFVVEPSR